MNDGPEHRSCLRTASSRLIVMETGTAHEDLVYNRIGCDEPGLADEIRAFLRDPDSE